MDLKPQDLARLRAIAVRAIDDAYDVLAAAAARPKPSVTRAASGPADRTPETAERGATPPKLAYTIAEAAAALGLSRSTLYNLMASGALPAPRVGRRRLLPASAVEALILSRQETKSPQADGKADERGA